MATTQFIKIDFDAKKAMSALNTLERRQFPFAFAKSLTETAEAARQGVGIQSRREFGLHSEFIPRNIKKSGASKQDFTSFGFAEAAVFTGRRLDDWMGAHETGGTRKPGTGGVGGRDRGSHLALPGKGLKKRSFKTRSGKIRSRWKPKRLLEKFNDGRGGRTVKGGRGGRKKEPFVIRGKNSGVPMIVRRISKKRYPLEVLYVFVKDAKIDKKWGFEKTVRRVANGVFKKKLSKNLVMAVKNSR